MTMLAGALPEVTRSSLESMRLTKSDHKLFILPILTDDRSRLIFGGMTVLRL